MNLLNRRERLRSARSSPGRLRGSCQALACAALLIPAVPLAEGQAATGTTAPVSINFTGGTMSETIEIPPGASGAVITFVDEDPVWDDVLGATSAAIPVGATEMRVSMMWICIGGEVYGPHGESGEKCPKVYVRVVWQGTVYPDTVTSTHELCCP